MTQDNKFLTEEGNAYWRRNRTATAQWNPTHDLPLKLIDMYDLQFASVLEIGAANGYRLGELQRRQPDAKYTAVEPSIDAIHDGMRQYPEILYLQATAGNIPLCDNSFDLVIVHYVLHWVDRTKLCHSISEIDRVIQENGFLLLGDFYPDSPCRVPYHHTSGISTWKQDYSTMFISTGRYQLVAMLSNKHSGSLRANVPEQERGAIWLLQKCPLDSIRTAHL